jgi:HEAT repeat protein
LSDLVKRVREGDMAAAKLYWPLARTPCPLSLKNLKILSTNPKRTERQTAWLIFLSKSGGQCQTAHQQTRQEPPRLLCVGRIGSEEALEALIRELTSVNWRRVEAACIGLGLTENPNAAYVIAHLENTRKTTRVGEVFAAAGSAMTALQRRLATRM